jgi:hypothetical protein
MMSFRFFVDDSLTKAMGNAVNRLGRRQAEFVFRYFGDRDRGGKEENGETPFHARGRDGEEEEKRERKRTSTRTRAHLRLLRFLLRFSHCVLSFRVPHLLFHRLFYLGLPSRFCPTRFGAVLLLFWSAVVLSRKGRQAGRQKRSALCFWFGFVVVVALGVRLLSVCCFPSFRRLRRFSFVGLFRGFVSVAGSSICCLLILCVKSGKRKCLMGSERVLRMGLQLKTKSELALLRSLRD